MKGDHRAPSTFPVQCSTLQINGYAMIKKRPCKLSEVSASETDGKVHLVGTDIFTNKKYEDSLQPSDNIEVPMVKLNDYQLLDIEDNLCSMISQMRSVKSNLRLPEGELGTKIATEFEKSKKIIVTVISAAGEEAISDFKIIDG
ncbi:uncharacterized protein LOC128390197 [Panonychus citri]|uniref:uncharacterized protein LOC128386019 n=1 Tax=Panonychus citri TaxID=50023 RepID=UPI0023080A5B|nr:uncharacterized protein LOC128386019 [Panonychus citri]XP_053205850.1 uncharacterized protein LOC128390197 [Panonychus citri]